MGRYTVKLETLKRPLYENWKVFAIDGTLLFRCNRDRADWYISRGLAEFLSPTEVRLLFKTKGPGANGDPYYLADQKNQCVVCGSSKDLTRHHVIPWCYRRHFPEGLKSHNWFDIVLLCVTCHEKYEVHADKLKVKIAGEFGIPVYGIRQIMELDKLKVIKHASALKKWSHKIPEDKKELLLLTLKQWFNKDEISDQDIAIASRLKLDVIPAISAGKIIVEQCDDLDAFVRRWREHFLLNMKPMFLSENWTVEHSVW